MLPFRVEFIRLLFTIEGAVFRLKIQDEKYPRKSNLKIWKELYLAAFIMSSQNFSLFILAYFIYWVVR